MMRKGTSKKRPTGIEFVFDSFSSPRLQIQPELFGILDLHSAVLLCLLFRSKNISDFGQQYEEVKEFGRCDSKIELIPWFTLDQNDLALLRFSKAAIVKSFRILKRKKFIKVDQDGDIFIDYEKIRAALRA